MTRTYRKKKSQKIPKNLRSKTPNPKPEKNDVKTTVSELEKCC